MKLERMVVIEAMFCSACGAELKRGVKVGVFLSGEDIFCFCGDCDLQFRDLVEMLALSSGIIKNGGEKGYGKKIVNRNDRV